jgi:hypothetical protein
VQLQLQQSLNRINVTTEYQIRQTGITSNCV